jgi:hypothetical protein
MPAGQCRAHVVNAAGARHGSRQHQVHAIGAALHARVHLLQDVRYLVRHLARQAQHRVAPGAGDLHHHIHRMREAENRVRNAQPVADRRAQGWLHAAYCGVMPAC